MEATVLSVGKSVLDGALGYAKSALAEEVALQLGVRRDQLFITNELEMMRAFLMSAHDERDANHVVKAWVKQVRDVSYDVEDSLQEFAVRLGRQSWWRIYCTLQDQRHVANQMRELRANVEDVSQRNMRYHLISKGSGSRPVMAVEQSSIVYAERFSIDGAAKKPKVDLFQLINKEENDLRVIAVWGASVDFRQTSIIRAAYDDPDIKSIFPCRAWVRLMHPFNPKDFIQSFVEQFYAPAGVNSLLGTEKTSQELADEFNGHVNEKKYLVVLNDLSTVEEWDRIKKCFPKKKNGSIIIVSTSQVEVARLCAGQEYIESELKHSTTDDSIYACYDKGSQDGTDFIRTGSSSNVATTSTGKKPIAPTGEILEDQPMGPDENKVVVKSLSRIRTMAAALEESRIFGRLEEKDEIIKLIKNQGTKQSKAVISVWGMGGLGKSTLIKDVYQSQEISGTFDKRAFVRIMRPFNREELLRNLVMQLDTQLSEKKEVPLMELEDSTNKLEGLIENKMCLIVLDDVSSTIEWDTIIPYFRKMKNKSWIIVTTREENIAKHCSAKEQENYYYLLGGLEKKDARDLFTEKVFGKTTDLDKEYPELVKEADLILKKCSGLPLALVTIGGFLANQPKTNMEWKQLNEHISAELEMNPELGIIKTVLTKSFNGLPYHLKSCFLYMPIFPEGYRIGMWRLVRRWTAEGYSAEVRGKSAEEILKGYFMELISRSVILPSRQLVHSTLKELDSCQVHDMMREIAISRSMEENLVFRLEEGCNSNTMGAARHITINNNWKGDQSEFESIVDMSRVRSITVFGDWKSFFISNKMIMLRVLDLENTTGLRDHHVKHIGKLLHLRYLSLRGCHHICHLPESLGNLRQLETLDIQGAKIVKLPKSINRLEKLTFLFAGRYSMSEDLSFKKVVCEVPKIMQSKLCAPLALVCLACHRMSDDDGMNHRDKCTAICCVKLPVFTKRLDIHGVVVPRGMKKLKAMRILGVVNISQGKDVLKDISGLTQLRILAVTGINQKNGQEFCSAIAGLRHLESLTIRSEGDPGLRGCLDTMSSPPENLEILKLYGNLLELPKWVEHLKDLVMLTLRSTKLSNAIATMEILGKLPKLASLHLLEWSFHGEGLCLNFQPEVFPCLVVLDLSYVYVKFEHRAAPKLALLKFTCVDIDSRSASGLNYLSSLKEVVLQGDYSSEKLEYLGLELANNPNKPVYKRI